MTSKNSSANLAIYLIRPYLGIATWYGKRKGAGQSKKPVLESRQWQLLLLDVKPAERWITMMNT